jgi:hypothetical protein
VADRLRKEPDTQVDVIDGMRGEMTVTVDGREVARKENDRLPEPDQVAAAVKGEPAAAP